MRIGLDLDGVIINLMPEILRRWNRDHGTDIKEEDMVLYDSLMELAGSVVYLKVWWKQQVLSGMYLQARLYRGASDFIEELGRKHDIVIITSRLDVLPQVISDTAESLDYYKIPYKELHFIKEKYLVECDVYIEDSPPCIKELWQAHKNVIMPRRPWNQELEYISFNEEDNYKNEDAFDTWEEALDMIEYFSREKETKEAEKERLYGQVSKG
jgi:5'(3')-deoxyribonucleotidase